MAKTKTQPPAVVPERKVIPMSVDDQLLLDPENPRLASGTGGKSQRELLRILWNEMAVDEVALSIAANGFFQEEPLFVIPANTHKNGTQKEKYIVIEGNRRLAAVLLLRDDALRRELRATDLPQISAEAKARLAFLPVSIYNDRKELWEYYGFRHINGPKEWDAFSKAQYIAKVYEEYGVPLEEIARKIGDLHSTVIRLYRGNVLLRQAEEHAGFDKEDRVRYHFSFSHLYTAAAQPEFQKFLGIDAVKSLRPNPVPQTPKKLENLRDLMVWLYGSKVAGKEPVVRSQHPDLNTLREIINDPQAVAALRAGFPLERAYEIGIGDQRRFREALIRAKDNLQQAKGTVTTGFSGEEDLSLLIDEILLIAQKIKEEMESKIFSKSRKG